MPVRCRLVLVYRERGILITDEKGHKYRFFIQNESKIEHRIPKKYFRRKILIFRDIKFQSGYHDDKHKSIK